MKVHQLPRSSFLKLTRLLAGTEGWGHTNFGPTDYFGGTVSFVDHGLGLVAWEDHTGHGHYFCQRPEDLRAELFPTTIKVVAPAAPGACWSAAGEVVFFRRTLQDIPQTKELSGFSEHLREGHLRQQSLKGPKGAIYWTETMGVYHGRSWTAADARTAASIMARALWLARERGCTEARTWVNADHEASLAMHQALGFLPTGERWVSWLRGPVS